MIRTRARVLALGCLLLCSCSSDMRAGLLSIQHDIMPPPQSARHTPLKPDLRYLLVQSGGREALMVWVGTERTSLCEASVWVGADGVVVRLCDSRLVGISEPQRQWQLIDESAAITTNPNSVNRRIHRQITDQQPGFHMGMVRTIEKINAIDQAPPVTWIGRQHGTQWVEEIDQISRTRIGWYTVNSEHSGVAGQRCIAPDWCLQWQTWPPKYPASNS